MRPAASSARRARTVRLGPILPPAPRMTRSPERAARSSTRAGDGVVSSSSSSATDVGALRAVVLVCVVMW
ncbi:Uncharacterised protein [Mycobacteroides abscessus]|nr:Uncharacterised protein [Mycobacteroides abscessus]